MTPKMQLSDDVMVTDAFRAEINAWMIDFFGYKEEESLEPKPPVFNDANLEIAPRVEKKAKKQRRARSKTQAQPDMETFSGLLEGLDDSFYTMQVPPITGSWLAKRDLSAIKKMGIYVPTPMTVEMMDRPTVAADVPRAAISSAYYIPKKLDTKDQIYPRFAFCIKGAKLPEGVEITRGVPYQFGLCFEMTNTEDGKEMKPRTFWAWCWMVIAPDGEIRIPHELRRVSAPMQHKHALPGYKGQKGSRQSTAYLRRWCLPELAVVDEKAKLEQSAFENMLKCTFRQLLLWSKHRENQWSVGVRKDGHRVTFSIAPEHTSAYFADRDTVVNVDGKPRKIIHFVREHRRLNGAIVKAHVRGLREFDWKGYHCAVTAPKLNGSLFTTFDLAPSLVDGDYEPTDFVTMDQMAERLAANEDAGICAK